MAFPTLTAVPAGSSALSVGSHTNIHGELKTFLETISTPALTVLDDASVAAMVNTLGGATSTGSGGLVRATSPTLVTPVLGVAAATTINKVTVTAPATNSILTIVDGATLTASATATVSGTNTGDVANTAVTTGKLSQFAATSSSELAGVISDETGSGALVFGTSPTLVTPALGTPASGVMTNVSGTALSLIAGLSNGRTMEFDADQFENPVNSNWVVNALAPAEADSVNAALTVRSFDDTTEEGVGFAVLAPAGSTTIKLSMISKAATAPGAARTVGLKLYYRQIPDNAAPDTGWAGAADGSVVLTDIDIPTNVFFQYDTQTLDFVTGFAPDLVAGKRYQFELTRINPTGGTELTGDWRLRSLKVEIY